MKKSLLLKFTILLLIISTVPGCIWVEPIGYRIGDSHSGNNGNHHGNKH